METYHLYFIIHDRFYWHKAFGSNNLVHCAVEYKMFYIRLHSEQGGWNRKLCANKNIGMCFCIMLY